MRWEWQECSKSEVKQWNIETYPKWPGNSWISWTLRCHWDVPLSVAERWLSLTAVAPQMPYVATALLRAASRGCDLDTAEKWFQVGLPRRFDVWNRWWNMGLKLEKDKGNHGKPWETMGKPMENPPTKAENSTKSGETWGKSWKLVPLVQKRTWGWGWEFKAGNGHLEHDFNRPNLEMSPVCGGKINDNESYREPTTGI